MMISTWSHVLCHSKFGVFTFYQEQKNIWQSNAIVYILYTIFFISN